MKHTKQIPHIIESLRKRLGQQHKALIITIISALIVTLFLEITNRRSVISGLGFVFCSPHLFLFNLVIVFFTLSFSLIFKKRRACLCVLSSIWLIFGITDFIMRFFRVTPFSVADFGLIKSVWTIFGVYLNLLHIILIVIALIAFVTGIVFLFLKCKQEKPDFRIAACTIAISAATLFATISLYSHTGILPPRFTNLSNAYSDYGFAYCFSTGLFDRGIDEPNNYSKESVESILNSIKNSAVGETGKRPNIIYVQLESFFDVNRLLNISFSENPAKNFTALKNSCHHGYLSVPSIGAGTVNTEFEVLTGMSLDYFGTSEYPYTTILQNSTCETACFNLKEQGYACHAIHNYTASFYDRNLVYSNLGFDTFTSLEYIDNITYTEVGWAKDDVLADEVMRALSSTEGQDLVYTITVQAHGKYPSKLDKSKYPIEVFGIEDEALLSKYTYYINQVSETDKFIGSLISKLSSFDEPVMAIFFGDHMPNLDLEESMLNSGNLYQTDYVVWTNYGKTEGEKDLEAEQLSAFVMQKAGFNNGIFTKLHQSYSENKGYREALEMLMFDVLYGDYNVYGGTQKYVATNLQMGIQEIKITDCKIENGKIYVTGIGFTDFSRIYLEGRQLNTERTDQNSLEAPLPFLFDEKEHSQITVAQTSLTGIKFSETDTVILPPLEEETEVIS